LSYEEPRACSWVSIFKLFSHEFRNIYRAHNDGLLMAITAAGAQQMMLARMTLYLRLCDRISVGGWVWQID
jgi:hypothetical protein